MKKITFVIAVFGTAMMAQSDVHAQGFLKKLKDKASEVADKAVDKAVDKKVDKALGNNNSNSGSGSSTNGGGTSDASIYSQTSSRSGRPTNRTGEGIKNSTAPDVNQQITDADAAYTAAKFSDARFSIQQALLGVELQMGKQILRSLPNTVAGLAVDSSEDKVMSNQWGWSNLTIQRTWRKDDKQFEIMVGNNSIYSGYMNMLFNGNYAQSNGDTQNFKQTRIKGNKAVIKYDQNEGYTVLIQTGQSGMITLQGVNFANEQEMLNAVNAIDVDGIKKMLGEK